jgi:hypothetical protein
VVTKAVKKFRGNLIFFDASLALTRASQLQIPIQRRGVRMNEIVQLVSQKTGIPADKAQQAVEVVISHLKDRLPAPIASQLNQFVSPGETTAAAEDKGGLLGNVFGKKAS